MLRPFLLLTVLLGLAIAFACAEPGMGGGASPTEAYKQLYAAVKAKDTEAIKRNLTKKTLELGAMQSSRSGNPIEKVYENGFTGTTFSPSLPSIRDERIKDNMGAVEVWNSEKSTWEDLPFMIEDGVWKLAVGEMFAGSYKSPGKGRDEKEKEAANVLSNSMPPTYNANANTKPPTYKDVPVAAPDKKNNTAK
jgi:hypothetical protein